VNPINLNGIKKLRLKISEAENKLQNSDKQDSKETKHQKEMKQVHQHTN
jgi:hypothetical protein